MTDSLGDLAVGQGLATSAIEAEAAAESVFVDDPCVSMSFGVADHTLTLTIFLSQVITPKSQACLPGALQRYCWSV